MSFELFFLNGEVLEDMFGADDEDWQIYRKLVRHTCFVGASFNLMCLF